MREIPFTKAHGCGNDFLIVPGTPDEFARPEEFVRAICDRHYGLGADGVYFLSPLPQAGADADVSLYNSDGSHAELSGNGTRSVAAVLLYEALAGGGEAEPAGVARAAIISATRPVRVRTAAGVKELQLIERSGTSFRFRMHIGPARVEPGPQGTLSIWLGNPHCVVLVESLEIDWQARGRELGTHPFFPQGTNVDFLRVRDRHSVEARFWERGVGHTLASGTGSTAAALAAIHLGLADSPVAVYTEGGVLEVEWKPGEDAYLTGPAQITSRGTFFWDSV
jgi:diaminopimelate epimerase